MYSTSKVSIGVDPDSKKSGFAVFVDGKLESLHNLAIEDVEAFLEPFNRETTVVHVEDVTKRTSAFTALAITGIKLPASPTARVYITKSQLLRALKIAQDVGRNKASEENVVNIIRKLGHTVKLHEPSKKWKEGAEAKEFKRITGWSGRSNPETRSASWFGYIG